MPVSLDDIDVSILNELQRDADRPNVELARVVGLSPAATLNRVKRLKDAGVITGIHAYVDPGMAGYALQCWVSVTLARHDDRSHQRFEAVARRVPQVLAADWITGETDVLLEVVAHDVAELQRVLNLLSRGGASRILT